jgi:hypothetical protein
MLINSVYSPQARKEYQVKSTFDWNLELVKTFEYIKKHEGHSPYIIDDLGYPAAGFGCRLQYIKKTNYTFPIDSLEGHEMLEELFYQNMEYVEYHFPELEGSKLFALTHLAYCVGIGQMLNRKVYQDGELNQYRLYNLRKVDRTLPQFRALRVWEWELFNREYPDTIIVDNIIYN